MSLLSNLKDQPATSISGLEIDSGDGQRFIIVVDLIIEDSRKKKVYLQTRFKDADTGESIKVADPKKYAPYVNEQSEISIINMLKPDMFGTLDSNVPVPYEIFGELKCNRKIAAIVSLHQKDNHALIDQCEMMLLVNFGNKFTEYSDEKFTKYLKSVGSEEDLLNWGQKLIKDPDSSEESKNMGLSLIVEAAEKNSPDAQYALAQIYSNLSSPFHNSAQAELWLKKAADNGSQRAQTELATKYLDNSTQTVDTDKAVGLYQKAAESGNAEAQYKLYRHYNTKGETYDRALAFEWLEKSCMSGYEPALDELAPFYSDGYMDSRDMEKYMDILYKAADNNFSKAQYMLFNIFFTGQCLGETFQKDRKKALTWLIRAAENSDRNASYKIWQLYENGNDFLMEESFAIQWLQAAAEGEHPLALFDLGELYVQGRIVEKDGQKGIAMIKKSAELKNWDAQIKIHEMHQAGRYRDILFDISPENANAYLKKAAKSGNPFAQRLIWLKYLDGNPMMVVREEALKWLESAAELDHSPAIYDLANIYIEGVHVDKDLETGRKLLERAAKLDEPKSQFALFKLYYHGKYLSLKTTVNKERAYSWIKLSAATYEVAQHEMWKIFLSTNEMDLYPAEAVEYLHKAAKQQYANAVFDLGAAFAKGELVPKNVADGISLIQKAAQMRYPPAIYEMSKIYRDGKYHGAKVTQDVAEGTRQLKLAAEFGYPPAQFKLWSGFGRGNEANISERFAIEYLNSAAAAGYTPALEALAVNPAAQSQAQAQAQALNSK